MKRRSLLFTAPGEVSLREEDCPSPGRGEVLVETRWSAISPGTEMLIYKGQAPADLTADATIEALSGSLSYPLKYGYACVGTVVELGSGVDGIWRKQQVFAFNPHETHFIASVDALQRIPETLTPLDALFFPNMETALNFLHDGRPLLGERVAVFGQGVVGLLTTALLAELPLDMLTVVERYAARRKKALALGAMQALTPSELDHVTAPFDLCYEVSGAPQALNAAIQHTGFDGRIVIGSWYGTKPATLDLGGAFHRSRIQLISSQVSSLNPNLSGRWSKERRLAFTWRLLERLQPHHLISHRIPFTEAARAYTRLAESPQGTLQIVLDYV